MAKRKAAAGTKSAAKKARQVLAFFDNKKIDELALQIEDDRKYNFFVELLGQYEHIKTHLAESKDAEVESVARYLTLRLAKVFQTLFETSMLMPKKSYDEKKLIVVKWLVSKYDSFKSILLNFLGTQLLEETDLQLDMLDIYLMLIKLEAKHFLVKDQAYFPTLTYQNLISVMLGSDDEVDFILNEFQEKFNGNWDLQFYFFNNNVEVVKEWQQLKKEEQLQRVVDRFIQICLDGTLLFDPENVESLPKLVDGKLPSIAYKPSTFKSQFQKCMVGILSYPLKTSQYKHILLYLHKRVIPYMAQPQSLMDFLTAAYDVSDDDVIPILALNSLYELMKRYNLEYPDFYQKLYCLLTPSLLYTRYRSRFFRLCDLFLSSSHLSLALVASFIKKLARLALRATASGTVIVIPFIYNLMKRHPTCMVMIHRPDFQTGEETDPFKDTESDPLKTDALNSSLWELESIMNHYHPNVATLAKIFSEPFRKPNYNMEDFLDWNYKALLESESARKYKSMAVLEYQEWDGVFVGENSYLSGWVL